MLVRDVIEARKQAKLEIWNACNLGFEHDKEYAVSRSKAVFVMRLKLVFVDQSGRPVATSQGKPILQILA